MKFEDLKARVAEEQNISKAQADRIIRTIYDTIIEEVAEGTAVSIPGFGSFQPKWRAARKYYNMQKNEVEHHGPKKMIRFVPFQAFREAVKDEKKSS